MDLIDKIKIRLFCNKIGDDEFSNSYYEEKTGLPKKKRFVVYNGLPEPSKIPAEWHAWIHYVTDVSPVQIKTHKFSWQKIHLPNLTGTKYAYFPQGSARKGGVRKKVSSDYEAWNPVKAASEIEASVIHNN